MGNQLCYHQYLFAIELIMINQKKWKLIRFLVIQYWFISHRPLLNKLKFLVDHALLHSQMSKSYDIWTVVCALSVLTTCKISLYINMYVLELPRLCLHATENAKITSIMTWMFTIIIKPLYLIMFYKFMFILKHITTAAKSRKDLMNNPHCFRNNYFKSHQWCPTPPLIVTPGL